MAVTFALPADGKNLRPPVTEDNRFGFVLNVRPQSVVDPVIPPDYGFAILAEDGKVLFHSDEALGLEENFFDEVSNRANVRTQAQSNRPFIWTGEYHGRPHRLYMQPIDQIIDCPWRIVTFRSIEPLLAAQFHQQADIVRLLLVELIALACVAALFFLVCRLKGRELGDQIIRSFGMPAQFDVFCKAHGRLRILTILAVVATFVFVFICATPTFSHLDFLFVACAVLPLLAATVALSPTSRAPGTTRWELLLLLFLLGIAPAAGFSSIVYRVDTLEQTEAWVREAQQNWALRQTRVRGRTIAKLYSPETLGLLNAKSGFANSEFQPSPSYLSIVKGVRETSNPVQPARGSNALQGAPFALSLLRWSPLERAKNELADAEAFAVEPDGDTVRYAPKEATKGVAAPFAGHVVDDLSTIGVILGLIVLGTVGGGIYVVNQKFAAASSLPFIDLDRRLKMIASSKMNEGVMLIGPPRTKKDTIIDKKTKPVWRISLLGADLSVDSIERTIRRVNECIKKSALPASERRWVHVSNLETQLVTEDSRRQLLQLFERLLHYEHKEPLKGVIVSSSVDPIAHFNEIFSKEQNDIYKDAIPEVELGRSSLLLSRFHRCYLSLEGAKSVNELWNSWLDYDAHNWKLTAQREVSFEVLKHILPELEAAWAGHVVPRGDLARTIQNKAQAYYEVLWASCTRSEKLVLIQLAQEGFINPQSCDVMAQLVARGVITETGAPAIFNYTFRRFLRGIERHSVVNEWEAMEGSGLWVVVGRLAASTLIVGGLFYLVTQDMSVQSLLPLISGSGFFGIPILRDFVARLSTKPSAVGVA